MLIKMERLENRRRQDQSFAAPMPNLSERPRMGEGPRIRVETDTRNSMNERVWGMVQNMGPTAVTTAMLAAHPTAGAENFQPRTTRDDHRPYAPTNTIATPYFPDEKGAGSRPRLPESSLWANPHFEGWNPENVDTMRELRSVVKEDNRFRVDDTSLRVSARAFEHQWKPSVSVEQLAAAERLRPVQDDYRTAVAAPRNASFTVGAQMY